MFNSLAGTVTGKFPQRLLLDTHGIEWDIVVPDTSLDKIPPVGESARVFVWMQHTDSAMVLFGFASEDDRRMFFDLNKVDGVGPKSAVKIMSSIERGQLASALDSGNISALEKIPGLGKKTAQKMLLALKGKLSLDDSSSSRRESRVPGEFADIVEALSSMGFERRLVEDAVSAISSKLLAENPSMPKKEMEEALFRSAIVELSK